MNNTRILSVILPCYNVSMYLQNCINCIFSNKVDGIEVIFVDDGSTDLDKQRSVAEYFEKPLFDNYSEFDYKGSHVVIIRQENRGVSAARNRGIQAASGEYILFMDPDDSISSDWFENVITKVKTDKPDICLFAFDTMYLNDKGETVNKWTTKPIENYNICSNKEAVQKIFPRFLGYSVSNIQRWAAGEQLIGQLEFGAVWRNVYNRKFLLDNDIKFSEEIKLNEDSMFNAYCCLYASRITAVSDSYYYYMCKADGAMRTRTNPSTDIGAFIQNKIALAHERQNLVYRARERGHKFSTSDIAGSCILSVLEIMSKVPLSSWNIVKKYVNDDVVKKSISLMPFVGKVIFDFPLFVLKCHLAYPLFLAIGILKKSGINLHEKI